MDQQGVLNSTLKLQWKILPIAFIIIMFSLLLFVHFTTHLHLSTLPWPYFVIALITLPLENRLQITSAEIKNTLFFAGKFKLATFREVQLSDIDHAEVMRLPYGKSLNITTKNRKRIIFNLVQFSNTDALLTRLSDYIPFDAEPITLDIPMTQDIGQRSLYLIVATAVLIGLTLAVDHLFILQWHTPSQHFVHWLAFTIPAAIVISYLWIRAEKKAYPFLASCIVGLIAGCAVAYTLLITNHLMTEHLTTPTSDEFVLNQKKGFCQEWQPVNPAQFQFNDKALGTYVCAGWKQGYVTNLVVGATYRIAIVKGRLNDIAFPVDAFRHAVLVKLPAAQIAASQARSSGS